MFLLVFLSRKVCCVMFLPVFLSGKVCCVVFLPVFLSGEGVAVEPLGEDDIVPHEELLGVLQAV